MTSNLIEEDALRLAFDDFKQDKSQQFRLIIRRNRAQYIRTLMSQAALDTDTFNKEVWTFESETKMDGKSMKGIIPTVEPIPQDMLTSLNDALNNGTLELHGNYTWGSATRVYGSKIDDKGSLQPNLKHASQILQSQIQPLEKSKRLKKEINGFGDNISSGLVMMFHPKEFSIYNQASQDATRLLGLLTESLESFQDKIKYLKDLLSCDDYLELDWFLFLTLQGKYPDVFPFTKKIREWQPIHSESERISYREKQEKMAHKLLQDNLGQLTHEQLIQTLNYYNADYFNGVEKSGRFGQALVGNNRNKMLADMDEINKWIKKFFEVNSTDDVSKLMSEFLKSGPEGSGGVLGSLLLYTCFPQKYCIWVPAMVEGLNKLTNGNFKGKNGVAYIKFNDEVQRLRKILGLEPQELDTLLCVPNPPIDGTESTNPDEYEVPSINDIEKILRSLGVTLGGEIDVNFFKDSVEDVFLNEGRKLKHDWWEITLKLLTKQ